MPQAMPAEVRLTRTPLGGAADPVIEASFSDPRRTVRHVQVRTTQSVGVEDGNIVLDNDGNRYGAWAGGDAMKVEARIPGKPYATIFDGFIDEPNNGTGTYGDNDIDVRILGWTSLLDGVNLSADFVVSPGTAYTTAMESLIDATLGAGFATAVTADATTTANGITIPEGTSLRNAIEQLRAGLNGASNKWEYRVRVVAGARTFQFYKRSTANLGTITRRVLRAVPRPVRSRGSVLEVVNRATVVGGEQPLAIIDRTTLALVGEARLDASTKRIAKQFTVPSNTPAIDALSRVSFDAERSIYVDPPTLNGFVARSSDNVDVLGDGALHLKTPSASTATNPNNATDGDNATSATITATGSAVTYDLGATPPAIELIKFLVDRSNDPGTVTILVQSDDNSGFTTPTTRATISPTQGVNNQMTLTNLATPVTERYWRVNVTAVVGTLSLREVDLLRWRNNSTDVTNPHHGQDQFNQFDFPTRTHPTLAVTGAVEKELARWDFGAVRRQAKFAYRHQESAASSLLNILLQRSDNGSTWTTLAVSPSSTSLSTDTAFLEEAPFRYLRLLVDDDRTAASASITVDASYFNLYEHVSGTSFYPSSPLKPLTGDAMRGSAVTWGPGDLQASAGTVNAKEYPQPALAVVQAQDYFFILAPASGGTTSWWDIDYGTVASGFDDLVSTDSGATWAAVATDAQFQFKLEFDVGPLTATVDDAASQATYTPFMPPAGVMAQTIYDPSLVSADAVNAAAAALVNRRKNPTEKLALPLNFDATMMEGSQVTLATEVFRSLGCTASTYDVVEVQHTITEGDAETRIMCGEHFLQDWDNVDQTASQANARGS